MSFKSQKEIWEHLIAGGKVKYKTCGSSYCHLDDSGFLVTKLGNKAYHGFESELEIWEIYQEPKPKRKITLYRYTYDDSGVIQQSWWIADSFENYNCRLDRRLLMTESKEIEIEADNE